MTTKTSNHRTSEPAFVRIFAQNKPPIQCAVPNWAVTDIAAIVLTRCLPYSLVNLAAVFLWLHRLFSRNKYLFLSSFALSTLISNEGKEVLHKRTKRLQQINNRAAWIGCVEFVPDLHHLNFGQSYARRIIMINLLSFVMHSSCWWHLFCDTFRKKKHLFASVLFFVFYFGEIKIFFRSSFEYSKEHSSLYFMFKYISGHPNERSYLIHTSKLWSPLNNCSNLFFFTLSLLAKRIRFIRVKCQSVVDLSF